MQPKKKKKKIKEINTLIFRAKEKKIDSHKAVNDQETNTHIK